MLYKDVHDSYSLFGHVLKLIGYSGFLKGIYIATVREPYMVLKHTEHQLSEHKRKIEESEKNFKLLAYQDDLTGLPNRRRFKEVLTEKIGTGNPSEFALLLIDLDRFKHVNDTMGHTIGDSLLLEISTRLSRFSNGKATVA